ncbi:MAG: hypothetical protein GC129_05180 [Proteobacteria bacterium]|nr:hypothetical protein [Pseudomonadota bacterium]
MAGVDVVVEMVGGVEPAFKVAMGAMGKGVACVVTSPMLVAAHGQALAQASRGMHAFWGCTAAGAGMQPVELLAGRAVERMAVVFGEGASTLLVRMGYRNENYLKMEADLLRADVDVSDAAGKLTQARAAALMGDWQGLWPKVGSQLRVGLDALDMQDMRRMREFGLTLVYGAQLFDGGFVYTGPMAVDTASPLAQAQGRDVLLLEDEGGESVISQPADAQGRLLRGVVGDMVRLMRGRAAPEFATHAVFGGAAGADGACYLRLPYGKREALMAAGAVVKEEKVEGNGTWQAVVEGVDMRRLRMLAPDGCIWPVAGSWEMPMAGGLRLVG